VRRDQEEEDKLRGKVVHSPELYNENENESKRNRMKEMKSLNRKNSHMQGYISKDEGVRIRYQISRFVISPCIFPGSPPRTCCACVPLQMNELLRTLSDVLVLN
jgi:hypothetical protein